MPAVVRLLFFTRTQFTPAVLTFERTCEVEIGRGPTDSGAPRSRLVAPGHYRVDVPRDALSERHALVRIEDGRATLVNLKNRNGTTIRLAAGESASLDDAPVWLADELAVRTEDSRWSVPPRVLALRADGFIAWLRTALAPRGLHIEEGADGADTFRLLGERAGLRVAPVREGRTLDTDDVRWVSFVVSSWNAARAQHSASSWRFTAVSPERKLTLRLAREVAPTRLPVLLLGPTGVGKDVLANDLHAHSTVASGPFVSVNCALLLAARAESALFGHVRGAFTGAVSDQQGLVAAADEGTLFLDEVAELPLDVQTQLLRFLDGASGEYRRMGDARLRRSSARIIAATNADLRARVSKGLFRGDLLHRLEGLCVFVARPEPEDIELLTAQLFVDYAARAARRSTDAKNRVTPVPPSFDEATLAALGRSAAARSWAGNVRELRHAVERCVELRDPARSWDEQWRRTLESAPAYTAPAGSPTPASPSEPPGRVAPSDVGRLLSTAIFLTLARDAKDRSSLAHATDMSYQGADARLQKLGLTVGARDEIDKRLDEVLTLLRALAAQAPQVRALLEQVLAP